MLQRVGRVLGLGGQPESVAPPSLAVVFKRLVSAPVRLVARRPQVFLLVAVAGLVAIEVRTSWIQSRLLSAVAKRAGYAVEAGRSGSIRYPASGPYNDRLGYSRLPAFIERLEAAGYEVAAQARNSPGALRLVDFGLNPIYREKPQAGLLILDRAGRPLFTSRYPVRTYTDFQSIPPLIVRSLLFIENREALDVNYPYRNPSVEWERLAGALLDLGIHTVNPRHRLSGGSTLATQIEKIRHSPGGRTGSVGEKLRQITSASLRAYQDGANTVEARRLIVRDYVNSLPLAAISGFGEVYGLGDGLWAWYGAEFDEVNRLLNSVEHGDDTDLVHAARAYRQVLSLLLAVKSPSSYLLDNPETLEARTDAYLRFLGEAGLVPPRLGQLAARERVQLRRRAPELPPTPFSGRKGPDLARIRLLSLLGLTDTYTLDRLDLTVGTTLDLDAQQAVTGALARFNDPEQARKAGLIGYRMLNAEDSGPVIYSLVLYERASGANLLRVQADNYDQPLNINEGTKLELGSTAKLRTLAHYLEIVAALHERYAGATAAELSPIAASTTDRLTRWALDYLSAAEDKSLPAMLSAAMDRKYSASPYERFFTGGGVHTFANFDRADNGRVLTVRQAFERSVNLVFIRLMRDIVNYHIAGLPGAGERRQEYLRRFADMEGRIFLERFYRDYRTGGPDTVKSRHPLARWLVSYLRQRPEASLAEVIDASAAERQQAYEWLFAARQKNAQDTRIRTMLETDAFQKIHAAWKRQGFPFQSLVPSYATAIGSSGDTAAALAELAGIILNDGVRQPNAEIQKLHFGQGTPVETLMVPRRPPGERVFAPEVAAELRRALFGVVESGTARRAFRSVTLHDGTVLPVGGKTGTGDNRSKFFGRGGQVIGERIRNRTAIFVFLIGDRYYGAVAAYVPGAEAESFEFTSSLPVQVFKSLVPAFLPLVERSEQEIGGESDRVLAWRRRP